MPNLDATDTKILQALQPDGRQSLADLAEKVNLSASPCWRRVKQLEESGLLSSYGARLDRHKLGYGVTGFIQIQLEHHSPDSTTAFEREIVAIAQVITCHNLSGKYDYMLEVIARDLEEFSNLLRNQIRSIKGVKEISTSFSLREVKRTDILPVG